MEIIKEISEYRDTESWKEPAGFSITTTEQVIILSIDDQASCCERWGYFLTEDDTDKFIGSALTGITVTDTNRSGINFVKDDYSARKDSVEVIDVYDGDVMFVDIETDRGILQFVAYNIHNGYYGHEAKVSSLQLNYSDYL